MSIRAIISIFFRQAAHASIVLTVALLAVEWLVPGSILPRINMFGLVGLSLILALVADARART